MIMLEQHNSYLLLGTLIYPTSGMKLTAYQHLLFISHQSRISENWINKNEIQEWPSPRNEIGILPVKVNHRKQAGGRGLSR